MLNAAVPARVLRNFTSRPSLRRHAQQRFLHHCQALLLRAVVLDDFAGRRAGFVSQRRDQERILRRCWLLCNCRHWSVSFYSLFHSMCNLHDHSLVMLAVDQELPLLFFRHVFDLRARAASQRLAPYALSCWFSIESYFPAQEASCSDYSQLPDFTFRIRGAS